MYYYFFGGIIIIIILLTIGSLSRKKIYTAIDNLEAKKIQIMNKPLTDEISKVKGLEMVGHTEEKFELWREEWDEIVTMTLPNLEELLFDAEEAADRYRFGKAKKYLEETSFELDQIESRISEITQEINELIKSEELNRTEIIVMKEKYKELRKYLFMHGRALETTATYFEKELEGISEKFAAFDSATETGNHLEARKILLALNDQITLLNKQMIALPDLLVQLRADLPSSIKDLEHGIEEMEQQGYIIEHLGVEKEIQTLKDQLVKTKEQIEEINIEAATEQMRDLNKKIEQIYDLLEAEVISRQFILTEKPNIASDMEKTGQDLSEVQEETNIVRLSYQIEQENLEMQKRLEKSYHKLQNRFSVIEDSLKEKSRSFTSIREMTEEVAAQLEELKKSNTEYKEMLHSLRKDELEAKEKIKNLRKKLVDVKRVVQKNNLPGLPEEFYVSLEDAEETLISVAKKLEEKPLQMSDVSSILDEATKAVDSVHQKAVTLVDRAVWTERLIQYGNRYRSQYTAVAIKLTAAEDAFRNYLYEEALELAAAAVDSVEPGILKELEKSFEIKEKV
jgi:septation ring formation regulator